MKPACVVLLVTCLLSATSNAQESQRTKGVIYGVTLDNQLMWTRHDGRGDGSFQWAPMPNGGKLVGLGWNFKQMFGAGNGVIYGITENGDLMWFRHDGQNNGSFNWTPATVGRKVGSGWNFKQVFSGGNGVIYNSPYRQCITLERTSS